MPHSEECRQAVRELVPAHAADGWCVGINCTFISEDYPSLWEFLEKYNPSQVNNPFVLPDMRNTQREDEDDATN